MWWLGLSKLEIKYLSQDKNYISKSTLIQYLTLLLIEQYGKLTLGEIAKKFGCRSESVKREIPGFIFNPSFNKKAELDKGLIKVSNIGPSKEFIENTEICFNENFENISIKILTLPVRISEKESKEAAFEDSQNNRYYQDQVLIATVIRIMKSRKRNNHVWLINEVAKQIEFFQAQPSKIKENIKKLIERGFIQRPEDDSNCYEYIG